MGLASIRKIGGQNHNGMMTTVTLTVYNSSSSELSAFGATSM